MSVDVAESAGQMEPVSPATSELVEAETLFRMHRARLTGLARVMCGSPEVADELVQDAFVSLITNRTTVGTGKELAYLRGVIVNRSKGRWRRRKTAERHVRAVGTDPVDTSHPGDTALADDVRRRIDSALGALSDQQRSSAALVYLDALSIREAAELLGIAEGSVKTHLHRARAALAPLLEDLR